MASVFYSLGIPLPVYVLLLLFCLGAIFGLVWLVWRVSPGDEINNVRRRVVVVDQEEEEQPQRRGAGRRNNRAAAAAVVDDDASGSDEEDEGRPNNRPAQRGARRGALGRMREANVEIRRRPVREQQVAQENNNNNEDNEEAEDATSEYSMKKIGKKKAEKLRMKEEKKLERQAELEMRTERKKREEEEWEERKRKNAEKEAELKKMEEEEEQRRIEREKQEEEEYNKMKAMFAVEGEGYSAESQEEKKAKLAEFAEFVKQRKVVPLEDLSAHFLIRTNEVIERIKTLEQQGVLSGVTDDRGKYIYITKDELEAVAKFIKRRGRISIDEIAMESNRLITFPQQPDEVAA